MKSFSGSSYSAPGGHEYSVADVCIRNALKVTLEAYRPEYKHLPPPVRFRATGGVRAWQAARDAAGAEGRALSALLADATVSPASLEQPLAVFIQRHCTLDFSQPWAQLPMNSGLLSVYAQAFWARGDALYEPTPALERLLDASDIGRDIPVSMIHLPAPALCIVPDPARRDSPHGFQSMLVFDSPKTPSGWGDSPRCLFFIMQSSGPTNVLKLEVRNDQETIAQAFEVAAQQVTHMGSKVVDIEEESARWIASLDYTAKLLLYLSLNDAQVQRERDYSTAPRDFRGLGKRQRERRWAEVERLYDRYIVGPTALSNDLAGPLDAGSGLGVSAHWRRGHFRMQPHGPQSSLRKVMFIMPTLVRADRLADAE